MKYYFIAGERSGDLHGSNLMKAITRLDASAEFRGMGGDQMEAAGMVSDGHYRELAFMGIMQVLFNIRKVARRMNHCQASITMFRPDAVVLIDYGGFNMRMARWCREHGFRVHYYIAPKVWAWNTARTWRLKATVDRLFCILPFEPDFFKQFDWTVDYVGNPVLDAVRDFRKNADFATRHGLPPDGSVIALLPGSRRGELKRIIPLMAEVVAQMPDHLFCVAAIREIPVDLYAPLRSFPNVRFVYDETYDLLDCSEAAVVTSGTATLETALFRVPQVVVYKASPLEYAIGRRVIKVDFISLVNLIAGRAVVQELLQEAATREAVLTALKSLLNPGPTRNAVLIGYEEVHRKLDTGSASSNTAQLMAEDLRSSGSTWPGP